MKIKTVFLSHFIAQAGWSVDASPKNYSLNRTIPQNVKMLQSKALNPEQQHWSCSLAINEEIN